MNPQDLILIALLPKPIDLERAQAGWYRVPVKHAPAALMEAKALAFYQPSSFGKQKWQVAWWGLIHSIETLPRRILIPNEPNHRRANQLYHAVRLAPLLPIKPPKDAKKGRRLLFASTDWQTFQAAKSLDELFTNKARPVADDPLYRLIQEQLKGKGGIPEPNSTHQQRLFLEESLQYEILDW